MNVQKLSGILAVAFVLAQVAEPARAGVVDTGTFDVAASVPLSCTLSGGNHDFGTYTGALNSDLTALSVTCPNGTVYEVHAGSGGAPNVSQTRLLTRQDGGADTLMYNLYLGEAISTDRIWTDTGDGVYRSTGTGSEMFINYTPAIPAGQEVAPGSYANEVTFTLIIQP